MTPPARRADQALGVWIAVGAAVAASFYLRTRWPWLLAYPPGWSLPIAQWINLAMEWFVETFRFAFQAISWLLAWPMGWIRDLLQWLPWPATSFGLTVLAYAAAGRRLAFFTALALSYMVLIGYWSESMSTLALVFVSVPIAIAIGLGVGIAAFRSPRFDRIVQPTLDLMQTVPTFAYLIPILLLFGFGPVVGLIASAIYACPPMVRNVILGLRRVPSDVVESGIMSGATPRQLLWWVRIPSAMPTVMVGVNQAVMAGLSMVIIAAIIGSSADMGWEVLSTMRKAWFGESLLAGSVIVLIAMVMDRISRGFAEQSRGKRKQSATRWERHRLIGIALLGMGLLSALAQSIAPLAVWPEAWIVYPVAPINDSLTYLLTHYSAQLDSVKEISLYYFLLPLRMGLATTIRPFSWGFELTPTLIAGYAIVSAVLAVVAARRWGWRAAVALLLACGLLYFGITNTPWPAFILVVTVIAWQVAGWRIGAFTLLGLLFMLVSGVWPQAMLSVYLCGAAVLLSFFLGAALGTWAAENNRVSGLLRPINDTLQTIPLFVFLIPVLMFFRVGEFTAFLAIIMYAIVPPIRYTEHGLRNVRPDIVEAATSIGCTRWQLLWHVKLPLALPEIMLGLNQTIMFGLAMLVITALVGTKELGQAIYIALSQADAGAGMVAGLAMAFIAMIADRIIQTWSAKKKAALGMA